MRRLIKDWLPIIVALLAYDLLRGVADGNLFAIHWGAPVHADKILGLGQVPTVRLQDALYTPGHLHFWDYAAFSIWFSHFFATLLVAVAIWLYRYEWFHRFAACIVVLAGLGLITYVIFPAAPPWLAADHDYIDQTYRITHAAVNNLPVPKAGAMFQKGTDWGNDVAAVPSLHAGYTMLICLFLWPRLGRRWRPLLVAYPIGMGLSLMYLGEHYLIDILLGWTYAAATILLVNWGAERLGGMAGGADPVDALPGDPAGARISLDSPRDEAPARRRRPLDALPCVLRAAEVDQGPGRQAGQRPAGHRQPDPARGREARPSRRGPLLRARRRRLPGRALPRLSRRPRGGLPRRARAAVGGLRRLLRRLRLDDRRLREPRGGRPPATPTPRRRQRPAGRRC